MSILRCGNRTSSARTNAFGHNNLDYYGSDGLCQCGQAPIHLLTAPSCDCRGRMKPPFYEPDCRTVKWYIGRIKCNSLQQSPPKVGRKVLQEW